MSGGGPLEAGYPLFQFAGGSTHPLAPFFGGMKVLLDLVLSGIGGVEDCPDMLGSFVGVMLPWSISRWANEPEECCCDSGD